MTRCLNCGAEREAEVCEACGLDSARAALSLRSQVLNRTAVFLLGAVALVAASGRYPALDLDGILIFTGALFFGALGLAIWVERRALRQQEAEVLKRIYYGLIPVPWLLAALLLINGAFDPGPSHIVQARVVGKFSMRGPLPNRRLIVTSWREGHALERILVSRGDYDAFSRGDRIAIQVEDGLAGIPWVSEVTHAD